MIKPTLLTKVLFGGLWLLLFQCHLCAQKQSWSIPVGSGKTLSFKDINPMIENLRSNLKFPLSVISDSSGIPIAILGKDDFPNYLCIQSIPYKDKILRLTNQEFDNYNVCMISDSLALITLQESETRFTFLFIVNVYTLSLYSNNSLGFLKSNGAILIKKANSLNWWLIINEFESGNFHTYEINSKNITNHSITTMGTPLIDSSFYKTISINEFNDSLEYEHFISQRRSFRHTKYAVSPARDQIGALNSEGKLVLFDFDRCSGRLCNYFLVKNDRSSSKKEDVISNMSYNNMAFSADSRFIYLSNDDTLFQCDLNKNYEFTPIFIDKKANNYLDHLYLAPDEKIYVYHSKSITGIIANDTNSKYLGIVHNPNITGFGCKYQHSGFYLQEELNYGSRTFLPDHSINDIQFSEVARTHRYTDTLYVCPTDTVRFGTFARPNIRYQWSPSDQLNSDTLATPTFTGEKTGTYRYILTVTGLPGSCWENEIASDTLWIIVREKKDTLCKHVGIEPIIPQEKLFIKVYPNPAQETVTIRCSIQGHYYLTLLDITGRKLLSFKLNLSGEHTLDVSTLPEGVYILQAGDRFSEKLVIVR
jgi:hypothetical protein